MKSCRRPICPMLAALLILALMTTWPGAAPAASQGKILTLDQTVEQALEYSPKLKAVKEQVSAAQYGEKEAYTYFLPSFSTSYQYLKSDETSYAVYYKDTYNWDASVSQPLFTGWRITSQYDLAALGVDVAKLSLDLSRLDVILGVREAYLEYLKAQKSYAVAKDSVHLLQAHLKISQDFYDVGIIPKNDVLKTKVELANAQQEEVRAGNNVEVARAKLNSLLGNDVEAPLEVEDILKQKPVDVTFIQAKYKALESRPELKSLGVQIKQADQKIINAKSGFYPDISLVGRHQMSSDVPYMDYADHYLEPEWQLVTQLQWTFWEWGRTKHQVSKEKAGKRQVENTLQDMKDQVTLEVKRAYLFLRESEKNIETAHTSITHAEENFRITNERFKEQLTTNTEVLDAQILLTQAQNNYYTALTTFKVAEARLVRAMGLAYTPGQVGP